MTMTITITITITITVIVVYAECPFQRGREEQNALHAASGLKHF